jgi:hypothetical protein
MQLCFVVHTAEHFEVPLVEGTRKQLQLKKNKDFTHITLQAVKDWLIG